uniref:uncharacterized protein si:dkey-261l7.2 n=1 Tax=Doryrhamphus excisus TaxID=161450 RepID=UPI0025AE9B85|nr:uncharacterized protein si:dkey-261l7.2 [Doryrhamphus excisus]XP_057921320.1 uncharacterized protein si:dkey-261l7.2 [Doryrhamphus excisus]XP_057921321.1 uncharacterized protein si:dkey-261l7.2 [Doryrhamphus excisus]
MPQLTATAALQLALLLSALPAQYLISRWTGSTAAQRLHASTRFLRVWKEWRKSHLNASAWAEWTEQQVSKVWSFFGVGTEEDAAQKMVAMETMMIDNNQGLFGASRAVRSPRPPYVFLRVGEVVMDRKARRVGVVVSWDPEMRAPAEWVDRVYGDAEDRAAEKTPHYKVLFSGPRPASLLVAYLPQTQLKRIRGTQPDIPTLEKYFEHFDGERFIPLPWLRKIFPEDDTEDA